MSTKKPALHNSFDVAIIDACGPPLFGSKVLIILKILYLTSKSNYKVFIHGNKGLFSISLFINNISKNNIYL